MVSLIAKSVRHLHSRELTPFRRTFHYNCRTSNGNGSEAKFSLGRFYELMSVALYGGQRTHYRRVLNGDGLMVLVKPDIVDAGKSSMREVKGNERNHEPLLMDFQMEGYTHLLEENPEYGCFFEIYRHERDRVARFKGNEEELFKELCKKTQYSLVLPFSIVLALWNGGKTSRNGGVRRYEAAEDRKNVFIRRFRHCTTIKNRTLSTLLRDPSSVISSLSMSPDKFHIRRFLSPERFYFERTQVAQFPIIEIREK